MIKLDLTIPNVPTMREISDLNAKINLLLAMRMLSDAELARLTDALEQATSETARLTDASKQASEGAARQIEKLRDLKQQLEQRDREIHELRGALDRKTTRIAALESSTSWKLTGLLRAGLALGRRRSDDPANDRR